MKILLISSKYPPEYSGSGLRAHNTYKRLSRKYNITYDVICNSVEFYGDKLYQYEGVNVTRISSSFFKYLPDSQNKLTSYLNLIGKYYAEAFRTFRLLLKKKYDLIHTFGDTASIATAAYLFKYLKKPIIVELCNKRKDPHPYLPILSHFRCPDLQQGTVFVAISKELETVCNNYRYFENVWCRSNPMDVNRFCFRTKAEKKYLKKKLFPFENDDKVLSFVAKFMPQKNHVFLLDVLRLLPKKYKLILAGPLVSQGKNMVRDKSYVKTIKQRISALNLDTRVYMVEKQVNMAEYLSISDVYLFPSYNEALGTPMLESIGCGVPVVANAGESAFRQWIRDGENGFLCELDAEKWVEAILKTDAFDDDKRRSMSRNIYSYASTDIIDRDYYKIFEALIDVGYKGRVDIKHALTNII